ncbi:hypothetical protein K505DRAFT_289450 [Melanomma pulvis-pyrius CBS 109.77]|uniref:RING-type E3 ubiquitin transferase n=1 Tax=Melanomma pulvis-pyrius CBS 109.77 TaxID=1314802 RepID=A0A6A6WR73_9PLEO|nr:hypothetical protein K505DRAFT_289450 [Melanomma pulvis-pyrius CBS 109.77]
MRPLRLLLSLCSSLIALTLLLYAAFGSTPQDRLRSSSAPDSKDGVTALFSFASPASLFPPSAIISLTDDNSTFFLARPAAFGPLLPSKGLSGPLWIGSGFGDEAMGRGELGCSDVPGWGDGDDSFTTSSKAALSPEGKTTTNSGRIRGATHAKRTSSEDVVESLDVAGRDDGTDDRLHQPFRASKVPKSLGGKTSEHADIQSLQESAEIAGKVVLLKRGGCGFLEKAKWAQRRGGVALIVGDNIRGGALIVMNARGDTSNVTIPALFTSHTTAHLLSSLLPSGDFIQDLSPEDAAKLELIKSGKSSKKGKNKGIPGKGKTNGSQSTFEGVAEATQIPPVYKAGVQPKRVEAVGWIQSFLYFLGFGKAGRTTPRGDTGRPPSSGSLDWAQVEDWDDDHSNQKPLGTKTATKTLMEPTQAPGDFVIGKQDWRDPDLLPQQTSKDVQPQESAKSTQGTRGNGEYNNGWFGNVLGHSEDGAADAGSKRTDGNNAEPEPSDAHAQEDEDTSEPHEGLWVTLAPTNMSSTPFFDTLLVLVISPLITLTVVYALLLLRSRIRRRRWRAPKSVVDRLPVRTYHTISDASSSPTATPSASSPTTPLLQHSPSRPISPPTSSLSRPRSRTTPEVPASSSSIRQGSRPTEEEKREAGLAEWRRRYGGRQKDCVVCLEEYIDDVSRVMRLPCGHEFHADCITPWLITRRRTCPICKGDVVRSLSQSYRDRGLRSPSPGRSRSFDHPDSFQVQAAETRNDSPSASRPVPISSSSTSDYSDDFGADVEANWADDGAGDAEERGRDIPSERAVDLSSSVRDLSSTVSTTIWRGFEAVRSATGLQRRPSQDDVDRDR